MSLQEVEADCVLRFCNVEPSYSQPIDVFFISLLLKIIRQWPSQTVCNNLAVK